MRVLILDESPDGGLLRSRLGAMSGLDLLSPLCAPSDADLVFCPAGPGDAVPQELGGLRAVIGLITPGPRQCSGDPEPDGVDAFLIRGHYSDESLRSAIATASARADLRRVQTRWRDERRAWNLMLRLSEAARKGRDCETVGQVAVDGLCDLSGWEAGHLWLLEECTQGEMVSTNIWHLADPARLEPLVRTSEGARCLPGAGLPGEVMATGQPLWIPELGEDDRFLRWPAAQSCGLAAGYGQPLKLGEEVVGVVELFSKVPRRAMDIRAEVLETVASIVAHAIRCRRQKTEWLRMRESLDLCPDAVVVTDAQGMIVHTNRAHSRLAGAETGRTGGVRHLEDSGMPPVVRQVMRTVLDGGAPWSGRLSGRRQDGRPVEVDVTASPIRDDRGRLTGCVSFRRDVSREVCLARALDRMRCLAALGQGIAGLAHRIKNIVSGLNGSAALVNHAVERGDLSSIAHLWPIFVRNTEILTNLLEGVLAQSKEPELHCTRGNLNDVVSQVVDLCRGHASQRAVEIQLDADPDLPTTRFDRACLYDAVLNLVENAIDACAESGGGVVTVATSAPAQAETVSVEIRDTGVGIPPELSERIFEPFFTTKGKRGTGLGLATCLKNTRAHGGRIAVRSQPGNTAFTLTLPVFGNGSVHDRPLRQVQDSAEVALVRPGTVHAT